MRCVGVRGQRRDHMFKIKKGMNLPIAGSPALEIDDSKTVRSVAILGDDYPRNEAYDEGRCRRDRDAGTDSLFR